ncbi:hypothetical protein RclHR1_21930005 [Rhizophagus clarus]|uniref:Uncharacterized protein n=1 Tax=Rhizophagus clarus TaxID=94130 RepID=A0A2Z6QTN5_9GLOM|nr:hypothetical protein RclHR1_21930005 [Rhizophagus clarus]
MQAQLAALRIQAHIGIDSSAVAGNSAGWEKAMGILRVCLTGSAARWYDSNILGKKVKLRNILLRAAHGGEAAFKALAGNAANCPVNIWVNPSGARAHMTDGADAGVNNPVTDVWPDYAIEGNRDIWLNHAGMKFTNDPLNHNAAGDAAGAGIAIAGGAVSQEPVILKPVQHHAVTQEEMNRLLQQQTETFQSQIRQLQESLKVRDVKPIYRPKPKPKPQYRDDWELYAQDSYPDEGPNPFDEDRKDDRHFQQLFDYALGKPAPRNTLEQRLAGKIAKRITKARERREDAELNRVMRELFLDDHDDPMDTSNTIRVSNKGKTLNPSPASKSISKLTSKSPSKSTGVVKIPPTNFTKMELINLLKLADIRKIIQEIVYKILENYESALQEQPEVQEEYLGPMAIDINVARLENSKDLLAINGNVNGIDIQCLANSCVNVSFI